ncbi:hypothetical protein BOTBODRAFT_100412 [Botryobasidium botryosum FD-172 SS1]|uniref:Exonuclease domain-containing protein n=1 Tax=Botryobasidium botryosum (strain FD-172 SS1) TaxID=930990 RepID=A0A067N973_BOTB1|nr:hypothetical protein BOTBODRAFT_100412 [Botryobasidium botryosum FD-172 SS1]
MYNSSEGKQYVALSCQCVGVGSGGSVSMLARVSLVDYRGTVVFDKYVRPTTTIVNYRTSSTGLKEARLIAEDAILFQEAQARVAELLRNKIIVGHSLWTDFQVLGITHPASDTRDVALFLPFRQAIRMPNQVIGLQTLVWTLMRRVIQEEHQDSVENARASMDLFRSHEREWEGVITDGNWPCALPPSTYARCYS